MLTKVSMVKKCDCWIMSTIIAVNAAARMPTRRLYWRAAMA